MIKANIKWNTEGLKRLEKNAKLLHDKQYVQELTPETIFTSEFLAKYTPFKSYEEMEAKAIEEATLALMADLKATACKDIKKKLFKGA